MGGVGDLLQGGIDVAEDLLVGQPKDHIVLASEIGVTLLIVCTLLLPRVDLSIELDDEPAITAAEIHDKGPDGMLPKELQIMELPASEPLPEASFRGSRIPP